MQKYDFNYVFVLSIFFLLYLSCAPIHSYWLPFMPCPPFEPIKKYQATILAYNFPPTAM